MEDRSRKRGSPSPGARIVGPGAGTVPGTAGSSQDCAVGCMRRTAEGARDVDVEEERGRGAEA
jgi:hypothetical protein